MKRCGDRSLSTFVLKQLQVLVVLTGLLVGINAFPQQADLQAHTNELQQALQIEDHLKVVEAIQGLRSLDVDDERLDFFEGRAQYHQKQGREAARLIDAYLKASPRGEYAAEARELQGGMGQILDTEGYIVAGDVRTTLRQRTLPKFKARALENLMGVAPHSAYASEMLCEMYTLGYYVEQDSAKARDYCESAYEKLGEGYGYGVNRTFFLYRIAHMKRYGFGGEQQVAEAMSIYENLVQTAEKDHERAKALARIAEIYLYGQEATDCETALSILPENKVYDESRDSGVWSKFTAFLKARIVLEETCEAASDAKWGTLDYAEAVLWKNEKLRAFVYAMDNDRQESHKQICSSNCEIMSTGESALNQAYQGHAPQTNPSNHLSDTYDWKLPYPHDDHATMIGRAALLIADELEAGRYVSRHKKSAADYLEMASLFGADVEQRLTRRNAKDEKLAALHEDIRQAATYAITSRVGLKKTGKYDSVRMAVLDPSGTLAIRSVSEGVGGNAPFRLQAIDMNIGQVIRNYSKMKVNPDSIALSPTGDVFAISSSGSNIIQFYSLNGEKPIHLVNVGKNYGGVFGGSLGTMFVAMTYSPRTIAAMSAGNKNLHWSVNRNGGSIQFLSFSPSGKRFAYAFEGGVTVADSDSGRNIKTFNIDDLYSSVHFGVFLSEDVVFTPFHDMLNVLDGSVARKPAFTGKEMNGRMTSYHFNALGKVHLAGGGRWLIAADRGNILILNPLSMEVIRQVDMGIDNRVSISEIVTTGNPRFVLVRDSMGILHRLEWTGMEQAAEIPTIAQVLSEQKPAGLVTTPEGPFAPCEVDMNGHKITLNDEKICKAIALDETTTQTAPASQGRPAALVTVEGGGMFGRRVATAGKVSNKKCIRLGIDDVAECKKFLGKSLLGQKLYIRNLNKQR